MMKYGELKTCLCQMRVCMSFVEPMSLLNSVSDDCGLPSLSLVLKINIHGWVICICFYNMGMFFFFFVMTCALFCGF